MSSTQPAVQPAPAPNPPPTTPATTPTTTPPVIPPELLPLFQQAVNTLPPGLLSAFLKQYWYVVFTLLAPLLLSAYNSAKEVFGTPAALAAIQEDYKRDHKALEDLTKQVELLDEKIERVLWILKNDVATTRPHNTGTP